MTVSDPLCPHLRTVINTRGGYHFTAGEPWDDIVDELLCLDCYEVIDEPPQQDDGVDHLAIEERRAQILKELGYD